MVATVRQPGLPCGLACRVALPPPLGLPSTLTWAVIDPAWPANRLEADMVSKMIEVVRETIVSVRLCFMFRQSQQIS